MGRGGKKSNRHFSNCAILLRGNLRKKKKRKKCAYGDSSVDSEIRLQASVHMHVWVSVCICVSVCMCLAVWTADCVRILHKSERVTAVAITVRVCPPTSIIRLAGALWASRAAPLPQAICVCTQPVRGCASQQPPFDDPRGQREPHTVAGAARRVARRAQTHTHPACRWDWRSARGWAQS